jgi:hypothetical protein
VLTAISDLEILVDQNAIDPDDANMLYEYLDEAAGNLMSISKGVIPTVAEWDEEDYPRYDDNGHTQMQGTGVVLWQTEHILDAYLETAIWAETDDDGEPLDKKYDISYFSEEFIQTSRDAVTSFLNRAAPLLANVDNMDAVGIDFWLTRNKHGTGFWAGDYPKSVEAGLTELAESYGEVNIYVGDDGLLYGYPN